MDIPIKVNLRYCFYILKNYFQTDFQETQLDHFSGKDYKNPRNQISCISMLFFFLFFIRRIRMPSNVLYLQTVDQEISNCRSTMYFLGFWHGKLQMEDPLSHLHNISAEILCILLSLQRTSFDVHKGRFQGKQKLNIQRFKNCGLNLMQGLLSTFHRLF